jgi:hypothetical protein
MQYHTIFFHGWSYHPCFWNNHIQRFYHQQSVACYNRGYYEQPYKPLLINGFNRAITHSMGLYFLAQDYNLKAFDEIIIYAGFTHFPSQSSLKAMQLGMKRNPDKIINDFQKTCGYLITDYKKSINYQQLQNDLILLEKTNLFELQNSFSFVDYTAYHGDNDIIVPSAFDKAIILKNTGHLCNLI